MSEEEPQQGAFEDDDVDDDSDADGVDGDFKVDDMHDDSDDDVLPPSAVTRRGFGSSDVPSRA